MGTPHLAPALVLIVAASAAGSEGVLLRLSLRPGDAWRERILHEMELRESSGEVVFSISTRREERVEVVSTVAPPGEAQARVTWALVRRTPVGAEPGEPYEMLLSTRGEVALPDRGEALTRAPFFRELLAGILSRSAPVLPAGPSAVARASERVLVTPLPGQVGPDGFVETETATLRSVDDGIAILALRRRADGQTLTIFPDALAAPGAVLSVARRAPVRLRVTGAAGEGSLGFDAARGRLLSYRMRETFGLAAALGRSSIRRTLSVSVEIECVK